MLGRENEVIDMVFVTIDGPVVSMSSFLEREIIVCSASDSNLRIRGIEVFRRFGIL